MLNTTGLPDTNDLSPSSSIAGMNQGTKSVKQPSLQIKFSIFPDRFGKKIEACSKTWDELAEMLSDPTEHDSKSSCPLIKLGVFGNKHTAKGSLRSNDNLIEIFGIECDYDGGLVTIAEAARKLDAACVEAFLYTTPSHTPEKPRWRVFVPLSKGYPPSERPRFVALINSILDGILAPESFTKSQTYYFGKIKGVPYWFQRIHGVPADDLDPKLVGVYPTKKNEGPPKVESQIDDLARFCTLNDVTIETIENLRSALMEMNSERADDRKQWIDVLEGLASLKETAFSDAAHDLAHEFSQRCPEKYDSEYLDKTWDGLNPTQITYRSIFKWAQEDGWINPRSSAALQAGQTHTSRVDRTDAGNATLLADITDGNLRYIPEHNTWLCWDKERWLVDQYGVAAQTCALKVAEHYHEKSAELRGQAQDKSLDVTERKRIEKAAESLEKWAGQCRNKRTIDSMLSLAKADERFTLPVRELDRDPWFFGVENGVVDLRTGKLREASRDEYVTRRSPVRFNPAAKAPRWCKFIEEITASPDSKDPHDYKARPNLANYMQWALAYSMTGSIAEHKMFICIGEGSNGKNILLDMLLWVMGDYCQTIPPEALMAAKYGADAERASPTTAMLAGARAAISSESKDGQKLDVALVKRHTGDGYMTARYMRENTFRFQITHKLWLMTNHRPTLDHMDEALRGRLHLIPFDMQWNRPGHPEHNPLLPDGDKYLLEKLKAEAEGILAWLIAGAVLYAKKGLEPPDEVKRMTQSYFQENDLVGRWLEERCEQCDANLGMKASELYKNFQSWCTGEGYSNVTQRNQKAFSTELIKRGIPKHASKDGKRYGLRDLVDSLEVTGDGL